MKQHEKGFLPHCMREIYPDATDEQLEEYATVWRRYMELMYRLYCQQQSGEERSSGEEGEKFDSPRGSASQGERV